MLWQQAGIGMGSLPTFNLSSRRPWALAVLQCSKMMFLEDLSLCFPPLVWKELHL